MELMQDNISNRCLNIHNYSVIKIQVNKNNNNNYQKKQEKYLINIMKGILKDKNKNIKYKKKAK